MVLTISTNTSALSVQRNLNKANEASASSLSKLSSGSRVPTAKDDAASLAIGSRVEAEIAGLQQASTNASQATSLLQIADGAYGEINSILVRQSTLAIQSSSGQLSDTERAIIDSEFQELTGEIDRIAGDTEFNGNQLLKGGSTTVSTDELSTGGLASKGIEISYDASNVTDGNQFTVNYDATDEKITLKNNTTGEIIEKDITDALNAKVREDGGADGSDLKAGKSFDVEFKDAGITVTLNDDFKRATAFGADILDVDAAATIKVATDSEIRIKDAAALAGSSAFDADSGRFTLSAVKADGNIMALDDNLSFSIDGGTTWVDGKADGSSAGVALAEKKTLLIANQADHSQIYAEIDLGTAANGFVAGANDADSIDIDLSTTFSNSQTKSTTADFSFKVGTGSTADDAIAISVDAVDAAALGTDASSVKTQADADNAITSVKAAIDKLQGSRAEIGASLSRLGFASSNLSVAIENQSAAKSGLLDVDVASETTNYAAKQVVVQAGVSLLAQANQKPQQLLKLIG